MAKNKQAFLVIPVITNGHHICEAFDTIADELHEYAGSKKSYVYDEIRFSDDNNKNSTGGMFITLICDTDPVVEIDKVLNKAKSKNSNIQFFRRFNFAELLNAESVTATIIAKK